MRVSAALSLAGAALALIVAPARAENLTVTLPIDGPGPCLPAACTLRGALESAAANMETDTIQVPAGSYDVTLGDLMVPAGVTLTGASARTTTANGPWHVTGGASLARLTLVGPVLNDSTLALDRVRVTGGGGIVNHGTLTLGHSLIDSNPGGGVTGDGVVNASDSTVVGNGIGGLIGTGGTLTHVTVARNDGVNVSAALHVSGSLLDECGPASDGGNVVPTACAGAGDVGSDDPKLAAALANAGGETDVLRIAPGSAAVGVAGACTGTDQRELARPQGTACDAGAYELEVVQVTGPEGPTRETPVTYTFTAALGSSFRCGLDGAALEACASPASLPGLADGEHTFTVQAFVGDDAVSDAATRRFTLDTTVAATPTPTPIATAIATATPTPVATPSYRKTVVLRPQAGRTLVRRPGETAFSEIRSRTPVAVGTSVDVKQGSVIVTAATPSSTETAKFSGGIFTAGGTDLTLSEKLRCSRPRGLTGDGAGAFRIRGRFAAATGRGAKWTVQDTCRHTRIRVARGVVAVRDKRRPNTILIRSGRSYTARPKR